jgi:hypothetical protein
LGAAEPWLETWRSTAALGWEYFERMSALADPRKLRSWWLADMRNLTSEALRSPALLALMRFNLGLLASSATTPAGPFLSPLSR